MQTNILDENGKVIRSPYILNRVAAGGKLYFMVAIPNLKTKNSNEFKNCSSPLRRDRNPSFNIKNDLSTNTWRYSDFGDPTSRGNHYDLAAKRHGLDVKVDFKEVLEKMYLDLEIDKIDKQELQKFINHGCGTIDTIRFNVKIPALRNTDTSVDYTEESEKYETNVKEIILDIIREEDMGIAHKEFLDRTGIKYDIMTKYNSFFISGYTVVYEEQGDARDYSKRLDNRHIWICYSFGKYCKIYSPSPKKFWYIGRKPSFGKYIFGTPNLYSRLDGQTVILTGGEKDTLCLVSKGYYSMCVSSETAKIDGRDAKNWYYDCRFTVLVIYDLDETGINQAKKIEAEAGIKYLILPSWLKEKGGKDITDFFSLGGTNAELDTLIHDILKTNKAPELLPIKLSYARTAAVRIKDAQSLPDILPHLDVLFQTNELTIFFGDTGKGKSIFAVAVANAITKGITFLGLENNCGPLITLYCDFELSDKQFEKRYTNATRTPYVFSDNFYIDNIDLSEIDFTDKKVPFEVLLINKIKQDILALNAKVLIIDNITFLSIFSSEDGQVAMRLMKLLKELKTELSISIMVLAHTPKKFGLGGITLQDLSGSKHLSNFCDSVTALGESKKDPNLRYIIQVKPSRTGEIKYDSSNVIVCEIQKLDSLLTLIFRGYAKESEHLCNNSEELEAELIDSAKQLYSQGKTYREIADELKVVSKSTVGRWLKPPIVPNPNG